MLSLWHRKQYFRRSTIATKIEVLKTLSGNSLDAFGESLKKEVEARAELDERVAILADRFETKIFLDRFALFILTVSIIFLVIKVFIIGTSAKAVPLGEPPYTVHTNGIQGKVR